MPVVSPIFMGPIIALHLVWSDVNQQACTRWLPVEESQFKTRISEFYFTKMFPDSDTLP